jgi:hypothetical protein
VSRLTEPVLDTNYSASVISGNVTANSFSEVLSVLWSRDAECLQFRDVFNFDNIKGDPGNNWRV